MVTLPDPVMFSQSHHILSQALSAKDPLLLLLERNNMYNMNEPGNLVDLPSTRALAEEVGRLLGVPNDSR